MKSTPILLFLFTLILFTACEKIDVPAGTPTCIIDEIKKNKKCIKNVIEYQFFGETIYVFNPDCSDKQAYTFNKICNYTCSHLGGINGNGQKCPVFDNPSVATNEKLIWQK